VKVGNLVDIDTGKDNWAPGVVKDVEAVKAD
jgi:hypothetical protein